MIDSMVVSVARGQVRPAKGSGVDLVPAVDPTAGSGQDAGSVPRILLVDDDRDFREALRELLSDHGFEVVGEAGDGAEGVDLVSRTDPDVVLMDLRMPNLDGIQATRSIKRGRPAVQVILLSAYGDPGLKEGAEEAGVYCYLVKGCPANIITDALEFAWRFKQETAQAPRADGTLQGETPQPKSTADGDSRTPWSHGYNPGRDGT
jgi:DNA-binding NarL/FixJ family response regulator